MAKSSKPTAAQAQLITYFDGGARPALRCTRVTYDTCLQRGWIATSDVWPYHLATDKGRAAVESITAPRVYNLAPAAAERRRIGDRKRVAVLREHGWTCTPPPGYKE
jgi:hypothetical protein